MSDSSPIRFTSPILAQQIAALNGGRAQTVKVPMVGNEDVSRLLKKIRIARSTMPSDSFRVK